MARDDSYNKDLYSALNVDPTASREEIGESFRALMRKYHPDATLNLPPEQRLAADVRAKDIADAYRVLSREDKRAEYNKVYFARKAAEAGAPKTDTTPKGPQPQRPRPVYQRPSPPPSPQPTGAGAPPPATPSPPPPQPPPGQPPGGGIPHPPRSWVSKGWGALENKFTFAKRIGDGVRSVASKIGGVLSKVPGIASAAAKLGSLFAKAAALFSKILGPLLSGPLAPILFVAAAINPKKLPEYVAGSILAVQSVISGLAAAAGAAMMAAVGGIAVTFTVAAALILIAVPLIMFIINSGGYIVPGGAGLLVSGDIPPGCPAPVWPVDTSTGLTYYVNQGPGAPATHGPGGADVCLDRDGDGDAEGPVDCIQVSFQEAIDIHPNGPLGNILASHPGTVTFAGNGLGPPGRPALVVRIQDNCGGGFTSNYVHLSSIAPGITVGATIQTGQVLGVMGCTGYCGGPHLHYEFRDAAGNIKDRSDPPPYMDTPYLPKSVPLACLGRTQCNVSIP